MALNFNGMLNLMVSVIFCIPLTWQYMIAINFIVTVLMGCFMDV